MIVISKCPRENVEVSDNAVATRAFYELDNLESITKKLKGEAGDYGVEWLDKGLVSGCFVSEFTIKPFVKGLLRLTDVLTRLRIMSAPLIYRDVKQEQRK